MNEDQLIRTGILVEIILLGASGCCDLQSAVIVEQNCRARLQIVSRWLGLEPLEHARGDVLVIRRNGSHILALTNLVDDGGSVHVVHQRADVAEAFRAKELFIVQSTVRLFEDNVALGGYVS